MNASSTGADLDALTRAVYRLVALDDDVAVPEVGSDEVRPLAEALSALAARLHRDTVAATHHRAFMEAFPGLVFRTDPSGIILESNSAAAELVGVPCRGEGLVELLCDISSAPLASPPGLSELVRPRRFALLDAAEQIRHVDVTARSLFGPHGELDGYVVQGIDVTRDVEAMEELDRARAEAQASTSARTRFLATVTHELRTPLNGLVSAAMLLESEVHSEEGRRDLELLQSCAAHMVTLVNDVLDFAQVDAGDVMLQDRPFDLHGVVEEVVELYAPQVVAGVDLRWCLTEGVPRRVRGDMVRVRQILSNLLANAVEHTTEGEIGVEIWLRETVDGHHRVAFLIEDSGCGIPDEELERIMAPFEKGGDGGGSSEGAGLGLAVVRALAEAMQGSVRIVSYLGEGTSFEVEVCLGEVENDVGLPEQRGGLAGLRLFLVDDNAVNRLLVRRVLEREGCEIHEAASGEEAVEVLVGEHPLACDLVLMDIEMSGMDGVAATRLVRRERPELPIVAFTAQAREEERRRCIRAGMDGFLTKPLDLAMVRRTLIHLGLGRGRYAPTRKTA